MSKSMSTKLVSLVIPVHMETERSMNDLACWLRLQRSPDVEIILAAVEGKDASLSQEFSEFEVIFSEKGRPNQMNAGARIATGTYLLFLHSDTRLDSGWIQELRDLNDSMSWGAFTPAIVGESKLFRLAEEWGCWRCRIFGIPYGDQCVFVKKAAFDLVGGFDTKCDFMEELELARRLQSQFHMPVLLHTKAFTSDRGWRTGGHYWYSFRNLVLFILFQIGVPRRVLSKLKGKRM